MENILIGCDPELFIKKGNTFFSAYGLIPGHKFAPHPVDKGAVQIDGMALEFNIHPAGSEEEFRLNVNTVLAQLKAMVPDYQVVAEPVALFTPEYMKEQPPEALELGCDPDFNGWTGRPFDKPDMDLPMRTASGHVHIGWTEGQKTYGTHYEMCQVMARELDFYLGLGSLLYDDDVKRRSMYGKAGCFRPKPYGVEYRTLSNAWLNSEARMGWVYRQAKLAVANVLSGEPHLSDTFGDIQHIINESHVKEAKSILKALKMEVVA